MKTTIGIGIIGCGSGVRGVSKETITGADDLKVVALFDPNARAMWKEVNSKP